MALGLHFGGLGTPLGTLWWHLGAFGVAWGARGSQDVLFGTPVAAAALFCWGRLPDLEAWAGGSIQSVW